MRLPSTNPITLPFGSADPPYSVDNRHRGTDFAYLPDDTIYAPAAGVVTLVPNNGNDGNGVYFTAEGVSIGLLHTSKYLVANGASVKAGDPVAIMGDTGLAQGKHLHFAVKKNGQFIDPMSLIKKEDDMIQDRAHLDAIFQQFFGRNAIQAEIDEWVGKKTYTQLIDVLQAQPAYKAMVHQQTVGGIAVRDNWEQQIYDLTKQVDTLSKGVKQLDPGVYQFK